MFVVISTGIITRWPIVVLNLLLSGRSISAPIVSGRHVTEVEAGASSEAKEERRGTLIRRTFPLIWASVLELKPGRETGDLGGTERVGPTTYTAGRLLSDECVYPSYSPPTVFGDRLADRSGLSL